MGATDVVVGAGAWVVVVVAVVAVGAPVVGAAVVAESLVVGAASSPQPAAATMRTKQVRIDRNLMPTPDLGYHPRCLRADGLASAFGLE